MDRKMLGIGLLGAGWMGRVHSNGYKTARYMFWPKTTWDVKLMMVGGIDEAEGKAFAERFEYQNGCAGYAPIISNPDICIFDNVTPDPLHVQPTMEAAKAGKNVICEKPIAVKASDAREMYRTAEKSGVKHMSCFSYRFMPAVRLAYELIKAGRLGKIYHFAGTYYQDHGSFEETPVEKIWYATGSGVDQGIATHMIDMSRFLVGEISTVAGMIKTYNNKRLSQKGMVDVDATEGFFTMLEFENGATGMMQSLGVANGKQSEFSFEIFGSKGSLKWDMADPNNLYVYLPDTVEPKVLGWTKVCVTETNHPFMDTWWPRGHVLGWEHAHINMLAHFLDCVADNKPVAPLAGTFLDGYKVAVIIETAHRSARDGVKLPVVYNL